MINKDVISVVQYVVLFIAILVAALLFLGLVIMIMFNVMSTEITEFAVPAIGYKSSVILAGLWSVLTGGLLASRQG